MKAYLCIDDTDNLDSIGTGELLENMMDEAAECGLAQSGMVVRYQLFIHEDIPYTSHNSSMCCDVETDDLEAFTAFCERYLAESAAEGSDPGLCVLEISDKYDYSPLISFGKRARDEVLTKEEAYAVADSFGEGLHLSEHGGTGGGVIGALAGAALRAGKEEGRIKGKLFPPVKKVKWTMNSFAEFYGVERFADESGETLTGDFPIEFSHPTKLIYQEGKVTAVLVRGDGQWQLKPKIKKK